MKRKSLFWMIAPCLLFAGIALWMRSAEARKEVKHPRPKVKQHVRLNKPFRLFVKKVERRPVSGPNAEQGFDTQVVVTLDHEGERPPWWNQITSSGTDGFGYGSGNFGVLFYEGQGKSRSVMNPPGSQDEHFEMRVLYMLPKWIPATNQYEARFLMKLRGLPVSTKRIVLRAEVAIYNCNPPVWWLITPPIPVVCTVRNAHEKIKMPPSAPLRKNGKNITRSEPAL